LRKISHAHTYTYAHFCPRGRATRRKRGEYTVFDDESAGTPEYSVSRVVTVKIDQRAHVATLVKSVNQPEGLVAASQGNAQTTPAGDVVAGWGSLPYVSVFDRSGGLVFNAEFPTGVNTYRAFEYPWLWRS